MQLIDARRAFGEHVTRVLLTGERGRIGTRLARALRSQGIAVTGFDRARGDDVLDGPSLRSAAAGSDAIVHAAALPDYHASGDEVMAVNVDGTRNVLRAAKDLGIPRVVNFSSVQVFGIARSELAPLYLPVDDAHPRRATRPYGISKRVGEDLCAEATADAGTTAISLRPVFVCFARDYHHLWRRRRPARLPAEMHWRDGTFVDIRDVTAAVLAALCRRIAGHVAMILSSSDAAYPLPTAETTARLLPDVRWRDRAHLDPSQPFVSPFDTTLARTTLEWMPRYTWSQWMRRQGRVEPVIGPSRRIVGAPRRIPHRLRATRLDGGS